MSYRLLYALAGMSFGTSACMVALVILSSIAGSGLLPAVIFLAVSLACGVSFLGLAKRQKLLYGIRKEAMKQILPPDLQLALDEGTLTPAEYDRVIEIGRGKNECRTRRHDR